MKKPKTTNAQHARTYKVDRSTIHRWKRDGAPIHDPAAMADWLAARHHVAAAAAPEGIAASRAALLKWQAARARLLFEKERGLLIDVATVAADMRRIASAIQSRIGILIAECPAWEGLPAPDIQKRAKAWARETAEFFHAETSYAPAKS